MPEKQAFQHYSNLLGFILVYSKWCKNGVEIMHRMYKMQKSENTTIENAKDQEQTHDPWHCKNNTPNSVE